jgi:hypothetical protein
MQGETNLRPQVSGAMGGMGGSEENVERVDVDIFHCVRGVSRIGSMILVV